MVQQCFHNVIIIVCSHVKRRPTTTILHIYVLPFLQQLVNVAFLVAGCCPIVGFPIMAITAINWHSITQDLDNHIDNW